MRHLNKRFLSLALVLVMVLSMVPATAFAEDAAQVAATVTEIEKDDVTFAVNFTADAVTDEQREQYGDWLAEVELIVNKDITLNGTDSNSSYIAGRYDFVGVKDWGMLPFSPVTIEANTPWGIIEYMNTLPNTAIVHTFRSFCFESKGIGYAVKFSDAFLAANPDVEATVQLKLTNPNNAEENIVIASYTYPVAAPALPTATVTSVANKDLTFAMNFKVDEISDEQLAYYEKWFADFELTINKDVTFNANGTADGWLSGRYENPYTEGWLNVPPSDVTLKANTPLKVMAYAAEMMGDKDLKYTFGEVYTAVQDFDCGVYFTPEFLAANPDLEVKLELKMYNYEDESESYVVGEPYSFTPNSKLPTATVTNVSNKDLTFAMNFKVDEISDEQLAYYEKWFADFELTVNKDVTFNANGGADGYLSGQYDEWSSNWVNVPFENVTLEANKTLKIMEYAADLLGEPGLKYTFGEVYTTVRDFDCGVFFEPEFLAANPDLVVTLELRMYDPADETKSYIVGHTYTFTQDTKLPTATVTEIEKEDLTFAMNFKADEVTDAQLKYYEKWYTDFELTVNKDVTFYAPDDAASDGYLSGQYENTYTGNAWVNVPFDKPVNLKANQPLKIMAYAAEALGEPGLKYTYSEVYDFVKDFNCGVFFTDEFLAANPDLVVTLELKMYNPADENESYVIGDTYIFRAAPLPTATVTRIANDDLTFALNFLVDEVTDAQLQHYKKWYADFELTVNKKVTFNANGDADGYLSGQYDAWSSNWVNVPFEDVTLEAYKSLKIMEYAAELLGEPGLKLTYNDVYSLVKDFDCGVFFDPEFLAANLDLVVTLELKMYNPDNESENYVIGETYVFTPADEYVAYNVETNVFYADAAIAAIEAEAGQTVKLIRNASSDMVLIPEEAIFDLNGYTLTADYFTCFGDTIDSSKGNAGLLVVSESHIMMRDDNAELSVRDDEGYRFVAILKFNQALQNNGAKFVFQPLFEEDAFALLREGQEATGVTVNVRVSWGQADGRRSQDFVYSDANMTEFLDSYNASTGKFGRMYALTLTNGEDFENLSFTAVVVSSTGAELSGTTLFANTAA